MGFETVVRFADEILREAGFDTEVIPSGTRESILKALQDREYQIFHFSGFSQATNPDTEEWLSPARFSGIKRVPELVFLHLDALRDPLADIPDEWMGAGTKVLIVCSEYFRNERVALPFAREFYRCLANGQSLGDAVLEARRKSNAEAPRSFAWAAQCYGVPDYRLEVSAADKQFDQSEIQSPAAASYGPWVLEMLQILGGAFFRGALEGEQRLAGAARERFYGAKSKIERNDFDSVRNQTEYLFHGPLAEYMKGGLDPMRPEPADDAMWRSTIAAVKKGDRRNAYHLSLAIARFVGFASPEELKSVRDLPVPDVTKPEQPDEQLRLWLARLEDESVFRGLTRYQAPFHRWFREFPNSLQDSNNLPDYAKRFITRWLMFAEVAQRRRKGAGQVRLGAALPAVASFQRTFPHISLSLGQPLESTAKGEPESTFSMPVDNYSQAVVELERLLLPALEREWKSRQEFTDLGNAATSAPPLPA